MAKLRIQKFLAEAGIASRRAAEEMVAEGRVSVNGRQVTAVPFFVNTDADRVKVDGRLIRRRKQEKLYYLLNKPRGVVCTADDPQGRRRAVDLVPETPDGRVYCVGRLDIDTSGLLILTNDGELTDYLTHPRYGVPATYVVETEGQLSPEDLDAFKHGVYLDGKRTAGAAVKVIRKEPGASTLEVTLREGRNREVQRVLLKFGVKVRRLRRIAIGPITDRGVKVGNFRTLTAAEVKKLMHAGTMPYTKKAGNRQQQKKK